MSEVNDEDDRVAERIKKATAPVIGMTFEEWWTLDKQIRAIAAPESTARAAWSAATTAERKQAGIDATRYRKLRDANMDIRNRLEHYSSSALDVAIDNMEEL